MARLCMPGNRYENLTRKSDGQYDLQGITTDFQRVFIRIHHFVTNSSHFQIRKSAFECLQTLKTNESDIAVALMPLDNVNYYTPVGGSIATVNFMAGLNYSKLGQEKTNSISNLGLLSNVRNFTPDTWCIIVLFTVIFISLVFLNSYNYQMIRTLNGCRKYLDRYELFIFSMKHLINTKAIRLKWICFLIFLLYFFLATPFLLMFKTNQLVSKTPYIVNSYSRAIESNVIVYVPTVSTNESRFLQPQSHNLRDYDIVHRFWKFFQHNAHSFDVFAVMQSGVDRYIDQLITSEAIVMSGGTTTSLFKSVLCAFAVNRDLSIGIFVHHDPHQREEVQGIPFRIGYNNPRAARLYRRSTEMKTFASIIENLVEKTGKQFLAGNDLDPTRRFEECLKPRSLDSRATKSVSPGNFSLFIPVVKVLAASYIVCGVLVITERIVHRVHRTWELRKGKKSKKK